MFQPLLSRFFQQIGNSQIKPAVLLKETPLRRPVITKFYQKVEQERSSCDRSRRVGALLFIATNNFTEYTVKAVVPVFDRDRQVCLDSGAKLAEATVDDDSGLTHIEVLPAFQGQGIGRQLIQFINFCCPQFHVFSGHGPNSRYRLSEEGVSLIESCRRHGILKEEQVFYDAAPVSPMSHVTSHN